MAVAYRCCATSGGSRCARSATRWPVSPGGPGPTGTTARWRKRTWLGRFVSTYGWRAYALPILMAITVVGALPDRDREQRASAASGDPSRVRRTIGAGGTAIIGAPPKGLTQFDVNLPTGMLPDGGPFTEAGARRGTSSPAPSSRSARAPPRCSTTPSRSRTASTPPRSAATTGSPRWSTRRWPTRRAGRTTRSSRSAGSTGPTRAIPTSGSR